MDYEELKKCEGKYCLIVLENSFHYQGSVTSVSETEVFFLDRYQGQKKFKNNFIKSITILPKKEIKEVKINPKHGYYKNMRRMGIIRNR